MSDLNKYSFDMATVIKTVKSFEGNDGDDVGLWLRDVSMVAEIAGLDERETVRLILFSLRGKGLSWASQVLRGRTDQVALLELQSLMMKRFGAQQNTDITLSRFLSTTVPQSREEFSKLLCDATTVNEKNLINRAALIQMVVNKSPKEIKALLYQTACESGTWENFIQKADEVSWIAFPDNLLSRVEYKDNNYKMKNSNYKRQNKNSSEKWDASVENKVCILHGKCNHTTNECKKFSDILISEREKLKKNKNLVNSIEIESISEGENEKLNKEDLFYICNFYSENNPFFVKVVINGRTYKCLIDTGADVSIIKYSIFCNDNKLNKFHGAVRSVCGNQLEIVGRIKELSINVKGREIIFDPLVVKRTNIDIILGVDVIKKYPFLLYKALDIKLDEMNVNTYKSIGLLNETTILENFQNLFRNEITELNVCSNGSYRINTEKNNPIYHRNSRIPIFYEKEIDLEISRNLKLGIIRPSKSPWCSRLVPVKKKMNIEIVC